MPTPTTWRADLAAAHVVILEAESAAHPNHLRKVYRDKPGAFGELPCAYVSGRNETITHDAGTRTRTTNSEVTLVDTYRDNLQTGDLLDQLVDFLVDRYDLPENVQRVPKTLIELTNITDVDVEAIGPERTVTYRGVVLTFAKSAIKEGRD